MITRRYNPRCEVAAFEVAFMPGASSDEKDEYRRASGAILCLGLGRDGTPYSKAMLEGRFNWKQDGSST